MVPRNRNGRFTPNSTGEPVLPARKDAKPVPTQRPIGGSRLSTEAGAMNVYFSPEPETLFSPSGPRNPGAPGVIVGDFRSGFGSELDFWQPKRRLDVACAAAGGLWTSPSPSLAVGGGQRLRAQAAMDGRACAQAHPDDHGGTRP